MWDRIPWRLLVAVLLAVIVLWALFSIRTPANAQSSEAADRHVGNIVDLFSELGFDSSFERIGVAFESPELVNQLIDVRQPVVFISETEAERETFVTSILELIETFSLEIDDDSWRSHATQCIASVEKDWLIYSIRSSMLPRNAYLAVAPDGSSSSGVFIELSRIFPERPQRTNAVSVSGCSEWRALTLNVLRRPAESIQTCMRATCRSDEVTDCRLSAISHQQGVAARLSYMPQVPVDVFGSGSTCREYVTWEVEFFIGTVLLPFFTFPLSSKLGGTLESQASGNGIVRLEDAG